jgi:RNA polymerase sigma-70 factor (ECF subfamily)
MDELGKMSDEKNEQFLSLFIKNQKRIYGFIASLVPNAVDTDDLMQETMMVMWRRFDEFRIGTDFAAWGIAIARKKIMKYRSSRVGTTMLFSKETIENILRCDQNLSGKTNDYMVALQQCLNKLEQKDRNIIRLRYENETSVKKLADIIGTTMDNAYKILSRIHAMLLRCVRRTIITWEAHP